MFDLQEMSSSVFPIPQRHQKGLADLLDLTDIQAEQLAAAIESAQLTLGAEQLAELVSATTSQKIAPDIVLRIVETIVALFSLGNYFDFTPAELAQYLLDTIRHTPSLAKQLSSAETNLGKRLERFFRAEGSLTSASKAVALLTDYPNVFVDCRILTDIRPIFSAEPRRKPVGAVITHTLKLEFHETRDHKSLYVAMDNHDLEILKEVIFRAEEKAKTLEEVLEKAGLSLIEITE